jgi:oligopeptide/dipeptide ABC transporter ATP-binding protein
MSGGDPVPLLAVERLSLQFRTFDGFYHALDEVGFTLAAGETLGIVGETGCGKSVLAKSIMRLLPSPPALYPSGAIRWQGEDVLQASARRLQRLRGLQIGMVFQDPMTFLDPLYTVGDQLCEVIRQHDRVVGRDHTRPGARDRAIALFGQLHLPEPERVFASYPHQLSGGMRQRVLIAMALSGRPQLLIADEPTTALDVTVQAQILQLISALVGEMSLSIMLISHDLGVIGAVARRIIVMYAGTIVEDGPAEQVLSRPLHPYTQGLLHAVPRLSGGMRPRGIAGQIPDLLHPPVGCRFRARCAAATEACARERPVLRRLAPAHSVACHNVEMAR